MKTTYKYSQQKNTEKVHLQIPETLIWTQMLGPSGHHRRTHGSAYLLLQSQAGKRNWEGVQGLSLAHAWLTSKLAYPPKPKVHAKTNEQWQKWAKGGLPFKLWRVHKTIIKISEYGQSNWGATAVFWEQRQRTAHKGEMMPVLPYKRE